MKRLYFTPVIRLIVYLFLISKLLQSLPRAEAQHMPRWPGESPWFGKEVPVEATHA